MWAYYNVYFSCFSFFWGEFQKFDAEIFKISMPCLCAIAGAIPPDYVDASYSSKTEKKASVDAEGNFDPKPVDTTKWETFCDHVFLNIKHVYKVMNAKYTECMVLPPTTVQSSLRGWMPLSTDMQNIHMINGRLKRYSFIFSCHHSVSTGLGWSATLHLMCWNA